MLLRNQEQKQRFMQGLEDLSFVKGISLHESSSAVEVTMEMVMLNPQISWSGISTSAIVRLISTP